MRSPAKTLRGMVHAARLLRDPNRLSDVIGIVDTLSREEFVRPIIERVSQEDRGARAFVDRPRVHVDLAAFERLPDGTLGHGLVAYMRTNNLNPADLPIRTAATDAEYLRAHLFETHDTWHVVTGFKTDVAGELGLQAFYLAQFPSRFSAAIVTGGMINALFLAFADHRRRMEAIAQGWAMGNQAQPLFGVRWDDLWPLPLSEVRERLRILPAE